MNTGKFIFIDESDGKLKLLDRKKNDRIECTELILESNA